ncbi:bifunctional [glutamine synthetase] adenylyltransferase/[glutamine synthetase]-adenylyl-L-tyrosine phosphorylase [Bifidobacterium sp. SMB2]|uniref:Bifunctional [glutamine synthetase] adenylyltransferase/[glutamine synthetase]-adenylyl-L-tyrosine phosphorylase n=1 Tax=Bifidobacterium saimiriisciurei TaxID=2661627 RepID=A0ABX0CCF7_9BIFI|nr:MULTISPECIES: bifunctional [glutamine synthetase] adenylyltransferase/[glutamine synthetase]-adenylyl-L-tyrosine phosphorylase [Bifidobacterium]NEG96940.1 bifunctional [glutamine synthetase] adenylyltransferase/[glutamine synthetase]-adenylyl-L-tyrosine phosphorylase [Bifidobacterium sp. SMB2]NEH11530.1 bifunctional [glutamine synthetase] adenylyltransferase/[glutamine synthetase]-adenylyl-L-tyrosine phosphorylase [Bifidobacterium saimiriisciurei]
MDKETSRVSLRELIRAGMANLETAQKLFASLSELGVEGYYRSELLGALSQADDPDTALRHITELANRVHDEGEPIESLFSGLDGFSRLVAVLGASDEIGRLMLSRPMLIKAVTGEEYESHLWNHDQRRAAILRRIGADPASDAPASTLSLAESTTELRRCYREQLAAIMARDVTADDPLTIQPAISRNLSDLADAALEGALAIARREVPDSSRCRFAIIGMGKLGARELNYVSDVDLIYVVEPADDGLGHEQLIRIGTRLGVTLQKVCQSVVMGVAEPTLWQIDGGLRPEGKDGPLVRTLDSHMGYYDKWAESWEFQALLKARPVAGDPQLGREYYDRTRPLVWSASKRDNFVYDCQQMRKRVEDLIPKPQKDREIKLGRGGLRDVEFTVQMLQLVHGRTDEALRTASTLDSLQALAAGGYVSRKQAAKLAADYGFERVLEHRQQMWALKRTHLFPDLGRGNEGGIESQRQLDKDFINSSAELRRLARALGTHPDELIERFDATRREVRQLHLDIYFRPMLPNIATLGEGEISLSPEATKERFASIGFGDPENAMRHVQALTEGISRSAKINRIILPAVLQWLGDGQNPDMGLLAWRKLEENFGQGSDYLGFLRDSSSAGQRLCHILSNSRYLGDAMNKSMESVTWLGHDEEMQPRSRQSLDIQCHAARMRFPDRVNDFATLLRSLRRHEIERIGLGWMSGVIADGDCLEAMTVVYDALLDSALDWSIDHQCREQGLDQPAARLAVIGMGRYGGREVNFSSDADVIIIYRPNGSAEDRQAFTFAKAVVDDLRRILMGPVSMENKIELDLDLRPEGKNGPLVRSYESCREYYSSWASTWEHQALLRARYAAGDERLAHDFLTLLANPLRYPDQPLSEAQIKDIRRLKARVEAERLPRGVRRERHLKLGKGGLSDVEWTVQLLQLQKAHDHPELQCVSTMPALDRLEELGEIDHDDAAILRQAWTMATNARNANYLWSGRANRADVLPDDTYSLGGIAAVLKEPAHRGQAFENELLGIMRKCRLVTDRLFYGKDEEA